MSSGLIKAIFLIIIGIILLSLLGINLQSVFQKDVLKENFGFLFNGVKFVWEKYLKSPANFIWGVFYNNIWTVFLENWAKISN